MVKSILLTITFNVIVSGQVIPDKCLAYEPTIVTLAGTLYKRTFPGPPNYQSIRKGDRKEGALLLKLAKIDVVSIRRDKSNN